MKLSKETLELMRELTQAHGISGDEQEVSQILARHYRLYTDEIIYDTLGSVLAVKRSKQANAKTVLLLGHMDEVGFIVQKINEKGSLSIVPIGGWWSQTLLGQRVIVKTKDGSKINGTIGSIPPHLLTEKELSKPLEIKHMLVDIGQTNRQAVLDLGINVGSSIVLDGPFHVLENQDRLLAKAWDNRYGCIMTVEVLKALKDVDLDVNLVVGASVMEEVGSRGAQTATYLVKPDAAIIFDCSPANDASDDKESFGQLGQGPLVRFTDANYLPHRGFLNHYVDCLKANNLPYQYYQSLGGTDAGTVHKQFEGVLTLTMCICARNIHTNSSIIDTLDYHHAYLAVLAMIRSLNTEMIANLKVSNQ
ncbi:MAG: M42 family metallopeptidase [Erysipelotrichaceae bacterium]